MTEKISFEMTEEESAFVRAWINLQEVRTPSRSDLGGRFIYKFLPTSLGLMKTVEDITLNETLCVAVTPNW